MGPPSGWQNPITAAPGQIQRKVDPSGLLPVRRDLVRARLEFQRGLLKAGIARLTPILVTRDGAIVDGHHAVRAAAEEGLTVDVQVVSHTIAPAAGSILTLPVR